MINSINHWLSRNPYTITSLVFLILSVFGWRVLGWGERHLGFLLLLYFIVTLGVKLDEISRCIGKGAGNPHPAFGDQDTVIAELKDIKALLRRIETHLQQPAPKDDPPPRP